jgi:hypothetical protein
MQHVEALAAVIVPEPAGEVWCRHDVNMNVQNNLQMMQRLPVERCWSLCAVSSLPAIRVDHEHSVHTHMRKTITERCTSDNVLVLHITC